MSDRDAPTHAEITDTKEKRRYWGSLLPRGADRVDGDDTLYAVEINRDLAKMFQSGLALVDWKERQELRGKWLALWLQRHFARFQKPMAVADLYRLSDSKTKRLVDYRKQLRLALADLQAAGVIVAWRIEAATDTLHIVPANRRAQGGLPTPAGGGFRLPFRAATGAAFASPSVGARYQRRRARGIPRALSGQRRR